MSTKDNFCKKNYNSNKTISTTNDEFMNVNLNVGHKTEELQSMQSKSNSILVTQNNKTIEDEPQQKLNNLSKESSKCYGVSQMVEQLSLNQDDKNCGEQNGKLEKSAINNSTLSLHIIAYENGNEQLSHDLLQDEQIITTTVNRKVQEDPFSLPREQKGEEGEKEVTEFHSSDRVINDRPLGRMPCFFQKEKETFFEWHTRVWSYLQDLSSYRNIKRANKGSQHQPIINFADLTQLAAKFPFPLCNISPMDSRPFMIMMNRSSDVFGSRGQQNIAAMGSRLRSAAPSAAGALTANDFQQAFDNTPPDTNVNVKTLPQRLAELNNFLTDSNKDWSLKSKMLISLRGCLIATNVSKPIDIVLENCGLWERCLIDGLKELRSTLTREYCITIAYFAVKLGNRFIRQVELMFGNLMNLVQNSAKIMSSSGVILSEFIARYVPHSKLITLASGYLVSKASVVRRSVVHMFDVMLSCWPNDILELHMNVIKEVIKSGLNDADLSCRAKSRDTYFAFSEKFSSQAQELYDSLDTIRQRALNDQQRSAASSTNSLAHERDNLHLNALKVGGPVAAQQSFLDNRSRSDVHFRYNGARPIPRAPPSRSRNTSPTRTNPHSPHSSKMRPPVFAKPLLVPKPTAPSARLNHVAPRINTNLRAGPSASSSRPPTNSQYPAQLIRMRANGGPATGSASLTAPRSNQPTVFGTTRNLAMPKSAVKPPTSAIQTPKYARPNVIRTVPNPNDQANELTSSLNNLKINSNAMTQSQLTDSMTSAESLNGNGMVSPTEHSLHDIIANINNENVDVKKPDKLIESLKTLNQLVTTNQLTQQHYDDHFNVLILYCIQLLRIPDASNTLKMAVLDALRVLIAAQPHRIADKAELALFRVLDAQDRDDATLTRCAEDCGAAIVAHLSVERCKKILVPLISNDQISPSSIASSLKLLCRKIESLSPDEVDQMFKDTRDVVVKSYEHTESMVRRASILFFVTVSNVIGTEPLRPYLAASIFKLVEVYRNKAQIKPRKASGY